MSWSCSFFFRGNIHWYWCRSVMRSSDQGPILMPPEFLKVSWLGRYVGFELIDSFECRPSWKGNFCDGKIITGNYCSSIVEVAWFQCPNCFLWHLLIIKHFFVLFGNVLKVFHVGIFGPLCRWHGIVYDLQVKILARFLFRTIIIITSSRVSKK